MAVGIPLTKSDIDQAAGTTARSLLTIAGQIKQVKAWLDATPDATLTGAYGYTSAEVATLKSAYTDLSQLVTIMEGGLALLVAKDFRAFAKQLVGILY